MADPASAEPRSTGRPALAERGGVVAVTLARGSGLTAGLAVSFGLAIGVVLVLIWLAPRIVSRAVSA